MFFAHEQVFRAYEIFLDMFLKDIKDSGYTIPQVCNMLKAHCQQITNVLLLSATAAGQAK